MTIRYHPRDETLMAYAAGALVSALSALVSCHLHACPRCRNEMRLLRHIGPALLDGTCDVELSRRAREGAFSRAVYLPTAGDAGERPANGSVPDPILPRPLARYLGTEIDAISWKTLAPGIEQFRVKMPSRHGDLRILRVQAGKKLLRHGHYGCELTMVLKGAYGDETGEYHVGEVADLDEDIEHRPRVTEDGECICIIAGETHPRYKTLSLRLLRPFLGF